MSQKLGECSAFQVLVVFGPVVWIPGIPENERDCYLGVLLESQNQPNHQLTISWEVTLEKIKDAQIRNN